MAGKIATRNAYGQALCDLAEKYPELVVLDADLANATMTKMFKAAYPDRFYDCGIAECNMDRHRRRDGCLRPQALYKYLRDLCHRPRLRPVRNSIAYPHLNVKVDRLPRRCLRR